MEKIDNHIMDLILDSFREETATRFSPELESWLKIGDNRRLFHDLQEIWIAVQASSANSRYDAEAAFGRFKETAFGQAHRSSFVGLKQTWRFAIAAVAGLALLFASYRFGSDNITNTFADIVIEAPIGSRSHLVLPDSTEIWLNAGSVISYSQGFGVKERNVKLSGEGLFHVKKNPNMPFKIHTNELDVKVLGTKFNFRNYDNDAEAVVTLSEGKISLQNNIYAMSESFLLPGQSYSLDKTDGSVKIKKTDPSYSFTWTSGRLFFDEELLPDIAKELERSYNVTILIDGDSLKNSRFYGDFVQKDYSINEIIDAFEATGRMHAEINENTITLHE